MSSQLRIAGTWAGTLTLDFTTTTVPMLRSEIGIRSNLEPDSINLIFAGRILRDENDKSLSELGVKNNAKVLATKVSKVEGKKVEEEGRRVEMVRREEEERGKRLARLKAAAAALVERHSDGSVPLEDYNIELEDQNGQKVNMGSETDQRAIMMGLMLHSKAKKLIEDQEYKDALDVLEMGEEAFSLCDPKLIAGIDNVPFLQIDMVWCYFMLRDISLLSEAGERLKKAREGIERSHGKDASRVRMLQEGSSPEIALYLRLELLEGVVAFHGGQLEKSRRLLTFAQSRLSKLQVSDEALSLLVSMGYLDYEVKRALWMNSQDIDSALTFLEREKERNAKKYEEDLRRQKEIMEQKLYGTNSLGKAVDIQRLDELTSMGFEREIVAESLRRNENDFQKALDDLTSFEVHSIIQIDVETRKRKRQERLREDPLSQSAAASESSPASVSHGDVPASGSSPESTSHGHVPPPHSSEASGSSTSHSWNRDLEMEKQLAHDIDGVDAVSDYDLDVSREAEAIAEYLALLDLTQQHSTSQ
ncbi:NEDD8 ultimate buster 1-like protein [Drosera capensis]